MSKHLFKSVLKSLDIYGSGVLINIRGKVKYTTPVGGVMSILTFALVVSFAIIFARDMVLKLNPMLINYRSVIKDKSIPLVNYTNFLFAFKFEFPNRTNVDLLGNPYWGLTVNIESRDSIYPDTVPVKPKEIPIVKCNSTLFEGFNLEARLKDYIIEDFYCLGLDNNHLYGSPYSSIDVKYIRMHVSFSWKKLMELYKGQELAVYHPTIGCFPLTFKAFYQSFSYEPDNFEDPFRKEISYSEAPVSAFESTRIIGSFVLGESQRDDGMIFQENNTTNIFRFNDFKSVLLGNFLDASKDSLTEFFNLILYIEYYKEVFKREYIKAADVLAKTTAIAKFFLIVFTFVCLVYNSNRISEQLAYKFFKFNPETNLKTILSNRDISSSSAFLTMGAKGESLLERKRSKMNSVYNEVSTLPRIFVKPFALNHDNAERDFRNFKKELCHTLSNNEKILRSLARNPNLPYDNAGHMTRKSDNKFLSFRRISGRGSRGNIRRSKRRMLRPSIFGRSSFKEILRKDFASHRQGLGSVQGQLEYNSKEVQNFLRRFDLGKSPSDEFLEGMKEIKLKKEDSETKENTKSNRDLLDPRHSKMNSLRSINWDDSNKLLFDIDEKKPNRPIINYASNALKANTHNNISNERSEILDNTNIAANLNFQNISSLYTSRDMNFQNHENSLVPIPEEKSSSRPNYKNSRSTKAKVIVSSLKGKETAFKEKNHRKSFQVNNAISIIDKKFVDGKKADVSYSEWTRIKEKLSFMDKFKYYLFCKRSTPKLKSKIQFYEKSSRRIRERMDIVYILNKLEELEKFMILFLNPFQALCMRYLKRPNIFHVNMNNVIDFYERFTCSKDDQMNIQKIIDYFEEKIKKNSMDNFDSKILEILDPDIKRTILINS